MDSNLLSKTETILPIYSQISNSLYPAETPFINYELPSSPTDYLLIEDFSDAIDVDYSCPKCTIPCTNDRWCKQCEGKRLSQDFENWTSNNEILDEFIRDTQRRATSKQDYLVWIDYDKFEDVEFLAKGGFGEVYYGVWIGGPERKWVYEESEWVLRVRTPVALKRLHHSENLTVDFLNELRSHHKCRNGRVLHCYGITQDKTSNSYMLVMEYANGGNLRHYLSENDSILTWGQKLRMLKDIALGLEDIHSMKLIHRDFHSGNLLQHTLSDGTMRTFVTDLGLCRPVNRTLKSISEERDVYGILPYIAPEILRRTHDYGEASDIYSFGMIMWEVLHGKPPFNDVQHCVNLAIRICEGFRPKMEKRAPKWYIGLMIRCWDTDHSKRPDISEVRKIITSEYLDELINDETAKHLPRTKIKHGWSPTSHGKDKFASRLLNFSNLPEPGDVLDILENENQVMLILNSNQKPLDSETGLSHADSKTEYSSYFSSEDERLETYESKGETDYITRAYDESLRVDDFIRETKTNSIISDI